jgi:hypothetical protein
MIFIAYLLFLAAVIWLFLHGRGSPSNRRIEAPVRIVAGTIGVALAAVGLILLARHTATPVGAAMLIALAIAASLYVCGILAWRGRPAYWLRISGWAGMTIVLLIPSTLSLALPFIALLAWTLRASSQDPRGRVL